MNTLNQKAAMNKIKEIEFNLRDYSVNLDSDSDNLNPNKNIVVPINSTPSDSVNVNMEADVVRNLQEQVDKLLMQKDALSQENKNLLEEIKDAKSSLLKNVEESFKIEVKIQKYQSEFNQLAEETCELKQTIQQKDKELFQIKSALDLKEYSVQICQQEIRDRQKAIEEQKTIHFVEISELTKQFEIEKREIKFRNQKLQEQNLILKHDLSDCENQITEMKKTIESKTNEIAKAMESKLNEVAQIVEKYENAKAKMIENNSNEISNIVKNYENEKNKIISDHAYSIQIQQKEFSTHQNVNEMEKTKLNYEITVLNKKLEQTNGQLEQTNSKLEQTNGQLEQTNSKLEQEVKDRMQQIDRFVESEKQFDKYYIFLNQEKAKYKRALHELARQIHYAIGLHPLRDYLLVTEKELSRVECELKKTPSISSNRAQLETMVDQLIKQRDFIRDLIKNFEINLSQKNNSLEVLARSVLDSEVPPPPSSF